MKAWLLDTLAMYARVLVGGARLLAGNVVLVVPALACLVAPVLLAIVFLPLAGALGAVGGVLVGVLGVLVESACWSTLLASTGEVIRTRRLALDDVRTGFVAYLGDVINVRFVLWLVTFVASLLPGPAGVMIGLATATFFNAVPELIYLGRYGTGDLLAASYRFISQRWIEWFPMNALLFTLGMSVVVLMLSTGLVSGGSLGGLFGMGFGLGMLAVVLAFAMLVRGLLFLELTESSRRARAFREAMGG